MKVSSSDALRLLSYKADEGALYWKARNEHQMQRPEMLAQWNRKFAGRRAGTISSYGYEVIRVRRMQFFTHRLVWELHHGEIPAGMQVDHINGDRLNNRITNLRAVTVTENNRNMRLSHRNTSGLHGVSYLPQYNRFQARIVVNKRLIHLGYHKALIDAAAARKSAEIRHGFHVNHGH